ncbi:hypothetical protein GOP47_0027721 [Adiantum capillus-veneris]|nr:hypothetical protein GOP47_0027721 [Adiantum capillus-veneris]
MITFMLIFSRVNAEGRPPKRIPYDELQVSSPSTPGIAHMTPLLPTFVIIFSRVNAEGRPPKRILYDELQGTSPSIAGIAHMTPLATWNPK